MLGGMACWPQTLYRNTHWEDFVVERFWGNAPTRLPTYIPLQEVVDRDIEWLNLFPAPNVETMKRMCQSGRYRRLFDFRLYPLLRKNRMRYFLELETDIPRMVSLYEFLTDNPRRLKPWTSFWDRYETKFCYLAFSDPEDAVFVKLAY